MESITKTRGLCISEKLSLISRKYPKFIPNEEGGWKYIFWFDNNKLLTYTFAHSSTPYEINIKRLAEANKKDYIIL